MFLVAPRWILDRLDCLSLINAETKMIDQMPPPTLAGMHDLLRGIMPWAVNGVDVRERPTDFSVHARVHLKWWTWMALGLLHFLYLRRVAKVLPYWRPAGIIAEVSCGIFDGGSQRC